MGKVVITGPGRSGTSFLVQLLTRLGEDTGFSPERDHYSPKLRAGCEHTLGLSLVNGSITKAAIDAAPRVLKSPDWSLALKGLVMYGWIEVDHVIIPFRDLDVSARSRLNVGLDWMCRPDGTEEERTTDQANIHALALGRALEACWVYNLPHTILMFPRLVQDEEYCYNGLIRAFDLNRKAFSEAWQQLANPNQIQTT